MYKTTINGQLILLQLIEKLVRTNEINGYCFYANTDGATFKILRKDEQKFYNICNQFSKDINIPIEFQTYKKCIIRDVNNYLIITSEGKLKKKGSFVTDTFDKDWEVSPKNATEILSKGFDAPVVAKAVEAYFVNGIPVREFISKHDDLYDFCKSQKVGGQFKIKAYSSLNGDVTDVDCQKTNRYIITNRGSKLFKINGDSRTDLASGFYVTLFNDYMDKVDININYYVSEANKLIFPFENPQLSLF